MSDFSEDGGIANGAQVIVDTAIRSAGSQLLAEGQISAFTVPAGGTIHIFDDRDRAEQYLPSPHRLKGTTVLLDPTSFVAFVEHMGGAVLYADIVGCRSVTAVFNGATRDVAGWADHRAVLNLTPTESWKRWLSKDGHLTEQVPFAQHIEDNLRDIVDPVGAVMLEMAQSLEASVKAEFKEANRLANGQRQFTYHETIAARAGEFGAAVVPEEFLLSIAPFEGAEHQTIAARLRFRIREGKLAIGYVLDRPDIVLRTAFDQVLAMVEEATTTTAYRGSPAS